MIKRKILDRIEVHLKKPEITVILGPRQVGKTTMMKILIEKLKDRGERTVYFNLDIEEDMKHFASQMNLLQKIKLEIGNRGYVFIDEIQRKENAGVFLKGLYDMGLEYKFIVSGSGSFELKEKLSESLAGRKRVFLVNPVSFEEFVDYKTGYKYSGNLPKYFEVEKEHFLRLLREYLLFGGYPKVITLPTKSEKISYLQEIYSSYVEKDITGLLKVHKRWEFSQLVKILAQISGKMIVYSNVSKLSGLSVKTLKDYLWYLEKTFIIRLIKPFFTNKLKEISKTPTCYFVDIGLRNYISGEIKKEEVDGFVFQNFILNEISYISEDYDILYYRSKDKAEVDFVLRKGLEIIPVEVKFSILDEPKISRSLRSFIEKYNPENAFIINFSYEKDEKLNETTVYFLPFYKLREIFQ